ncbi:MAG: tetratricopeptide repeat protein, partial [Acidobacteriota bacterium]
LNRGIVLVRLSRFGEAEPVLRKAVKTQEQSAPAHYFLAQAVASQNQSRFPEAEKEFVMAVKLGGDDMKEAHRFLAILYGARGDKKKQAAELEIYLRLVPTARDAEQLRQVLEKLKSSP